MKDKMHTLSTLSNHQLKEIIRNNFDVTSTFLKLIYEKLEQSKTYEFGYVFKLSTVRIDEVGTVEAKYTRYLGRGDVDYRIEFVSLDNLFKDQ